MSRRQREHDPAIAVVELARRRRCRGSCAVTLTRPSSGSDEAQVVGQRDRGAMDLEASLGPGRLGEQARQRVGQGCRRRSSRDGLFHVLFAQHCRRVPGRPATPRDRAPRRRARAGASARLELGLAGHRARRCPSRCRRGPCGPRPRGSRGSGPRRRRRPRACRPRRAAGLGDDPPALGLRRLQVGPARRSGRSPAPGPARRSGRLPRSPSR